MSALVNGWFMGSDGVYVSRLNGVSPSEILLIVIEAQAVYEYYALYPGWLGRVTGYAEIDGVPPLDGAKFVLHAIAKYSHQP
jgi:hypothetical protein